MEDLFKKGEIVYVCGRTGSGKTTLLKRLAKTYKDESGLVMQNPNDQIAADTVRSELLCAVPKKEGMDYATCEAASYFGISAFIDKRICELSGGEKQLLAIACVCAKRPDILILDEPFSSLDVMRSKRLLEMLLTLNREYGKTIIVAGHSCDIMWSLSDRIILTENGEVTGNFGKSEALCNFRTEEKRKRLLPKVCEYYENENFMSVAEAIKSGKRPQFSTHVCEKNDKEELFKLKNITYVYEKNGKRVLSDVSFSLKKGEAYAILGENGSGKSTLAKITAGIYKPYGGKISGKSRIGFLPQDVTLLFTKEEYDGKDPYRLSGGERQKLGLSLILSKDAEILVLDEPTKGLDRYEIQELLENLSKLKASGIAILVLTHDCEFVSQLADRCALLFDGRLCGENSAENFFRGNMYYTTVLQRLSENL